MKNDGGDSFEIPASSFKRGLNKTRKFSAGDDYRPLIHSVYCDIKDDRVVFVGTDGVTVSRFEDFELKGIKSRPLIIGRKTVDLFEGILKDASRETLKITVSENYIGAEYGGVKITSRLVEGGYVNYNAVFPKEPPISVTVNAYSLSAALKRLAIAAEKGNEMTVMDINPSGINLSSRDRNSGKSATETVVGESTGQIKTATDIARMLNVLSVIDADNAIISFVSPKVVITITPGRQEDNTVLTLLCCPVCLSDK
jgi:DNA polymerase-3 subunit beta